MNACAGTRRNWKILTPAAPRRAGNTKIAAALSRSEARLRLINDTVPHADRLRLTGPQIYRYVNKGYAEWFSLAESGIVGRAVADVVGSEVYAQVAGNLQRALAGERITYEYRMPRAGQTAYAHSTLVPDRRDGQTLGAFVFAHDITEQKRMQAALLQAQKMEAIGNDRGAGA